MCGHCSHYLLCMCGWMGVSACVPIYYVVCIMYQCVLYLSLYFGKLTLWTQILNPFFACYSDTHALSIVTEHLRLDGRVCFYRRNFANAVKPQGCILWPVWPLRDCMTVWGAKLILMADVAYPVSCATY